jgi:hypothetical protein
LRSGAVDSGDDGAAASWERNCGSHRTRIRTISGWHLVPHLLAARTHAHVTTSEEQPGLHRRESDRWAPLSSELRHCTTYPLEGEATSDHPLIRKDLS